MESFYIELNPPESCMRVICGLSGAVDDDRNCCSLNDRNSCDVWLSVKSTVDNSGSIFIYSYEEHECVSAKVVLRTSLIASSLSFQHIVLYYRGGSNLHRGGRQWSSQKSLNGGQLPGKICCLYVQVCCFQHEPNYYFFVPDA